MNQILFLILFKIIYAQESSNPSDQLCPCDLIANSCDVNCCCDPRCSAEDKSVFTECSNQIDEFDAKTCIPPASIIFNSTDHVTKYEDGLLCIYYDNYKQRNYYLQPILVDSNELFEEYRSQYGDDENRDENFQTQDVALGDQLRSDGPYYKYGDPMLLIGADNLLSHFLLPQSVMSDMCNYNTPASFLKPMDVTCQHPTRNLSTECTSAWHMNGRYFQGLQLLRSPEPLAIASGYRPEEIDQGLLNASTTARPRPTAPTSRLVITQDDRIAMIESIAELITRFESIAEMVQHATGGGADEEAQPPPSPEEAPIEGENITTTTTAASSTTTRGVTRPPPPPAPAWDGANRVCRNVPVRINYLVILSEGGRIAGAASEITYGSISAQSQLAFTRRFSIDFRWINDSSDPFRRSGNPGYVVGLPVMAGELIRQNNTETIRLTKENARWLTIISPSPTGSCISQNRTPVLFGENIQTGCLIEISSNTNAEQCRNLRRDVLYALREPTRNRIAIYGNVSVERTADWIPILIENEPQAETPVVPGAPLRGTCQDMILGVHYEILYAQTGSSSKPQAKIIGAKMRFQPPRTISVQCIGPYCGASTPNLSQKVPVISTVTFIDVSTRPEAILAEVPTFNARLPYDFFYPFSGYSDCAGRIAFCPFVLILCLFHVMFR